MSADKVLGTVAERLGLTQLKQQPRKEDILITTLSLIHLSKLQNISFY